jgi:hypothetical protein
MGVPSRVSLVFAAILVGVWAASCSSSSSGTGGTGGGGTGVDAGTGSGGSDAGGVDAGGPSGSTDAGTDGGFDGGGGGGGTDECAGVVPAQIGSSFTFDVAATGSTISCDQVFSDESGNLAASGSRDLRGIREWHLFDSNGAALTKIRASDLFGQGPGYEGLSPYDTPMGGEFLRVAYWTPAGKRTDGSPVSGDMGDARAFRAPGGILVVNVYCSPLPDRGGTIELRRFDPVTDETASTTVRGCESLADALVDANQNWLLLLHGGPSIGFAQGDLVAQWFDPTGHSLTGWFRVASLPGKHTTLLQATIGGGAALRIDDVWTYFLPSGKSEVQPAQEFLASHPESDFNLIRGAQGYAVFPRSGDTTQMELYSASGKKCGSLTFPRGNLTTGSDGSAIASSGDNGCTKTVWPALLK